MELEIFPSLSNFVVNTILKYDGYELWVGSMSIEGKIYRALYKEKNDILELRSSSHKFYFTPIKESKKQFKYMVSVDNKGNKLLYSIDNDNKCITTQELNGDNYGLHFK